MAAGQRTALALGSEGDWAQVMVAFELMVVKFLNKKHKTNKLSEVKTKPSSGLFLLINRSSSLNKGNQDSDGVWMSDLHSSLSSSPSSSVCRRIRPSSLA